MQNNQLHLFSHTGSSKFQHSNSNLFPDISNNGASSSNILKRVVLDFGLFSLLLLEREHGQVC